MLDPQQLEAAIRRDDSAAVRELLKDANEADRAACAKTLKLLVRGPKLPDEPMVFTRPPREILELLELYAERRREYDQWQEIARLQAWQLAALGLAGGVAIAAKLAAEYSHGTSQAKVRLVAEILADRGPPWLGDLVDRHLKLWGQFPFGIPAWPLARALVRMGAIPRPEIPEYTTLMPAGAVLIADESGADNYRFGELPQGMTPAQALLADPGLLGDEVWRLFTVPDAGKALAEFGSRVWWPGGRRTERQTWAEGLAQLSASGHLDRGRLIDACLDAFIRDFNPVRVGWYVSMLGELEPSIEEIAARVPRYLGLLAANSKTGVTVGQQGLRGLLDADLLDASQLLRASAPALLFPQKSVAVAQLKLVAAAAAKDQAARAHSATTAAIAFGHDRQDVQEAALKVIRTLGVPAGPALAEIRRHAADLSPNLSAEAADLGLLPDAPDPVPEARPEGLVTHGGPAVGIADQLAALEKQIDALRPESRERLTAALELVRQGGVPGPASVQPAAGADLPPPVTDPVVLVELLTVLMEDARDPIAAERALAGAVRLSSLPVSDRRRLAAPLLKRAERVMRGDSPFYGNLITSDLAIVASVWGGERAPAYDRREDHWHMPGEFAVSGSGQALTMAGIFSARAWEAARLIEAGEGGVLLAEPETERGAISVPTLLRRIRERAGCSGGRSLPLKHDHEQALLRLTPGEADESLWTAWAPLAGTSADALRESHRIIQLPVTFRAVYGLPEGQRSLRHGNHWHQHLLAQTAGEVPQASACGCWQLLTALGDPLVDHQVLYGPSRYELRHYDAAVAGWTLTCPWQPEVAAAHLLRPLSDGLLPAVTPAPVAMASMCRPGHALGPIGHLALVTGLSSAEPDARIAAAQLWSDACADGRLDPALAAQAIVTGVWGGALKLSRIADGLTHASHTELAARRIVETVCACFTDLSAGPAANLHQLTELAARLGARVGVPPLPEGLLAVAARRGSSRIVTTARQLVRARESEAPDLGRAAVQSLTALVARA